MFGMGHMEIAIIAIVAVLLFGSQLPKVARNVGRSILSFKQGFQEVKTEIEESERDIKERLTNGS